MEVEAVDEGVISEILVPEGAQGVKVNTPIATLSNGDAAPASKTSPLAGEVAAKRPEEGRADKPASAPPRTTDRPSPPTPSPQGGGGLSADPEVPASTAMVKVVLRDALRDAMAEEMRRDDRVFLMGEEVAESQGA